MKKNICSFLLGIATGVGLGILLDEKNKKQLQKMITHQYNCIHKKYMALRNKELEK